MGLIPVIVAYLLGSANNVLDLARRVADSFGKVWDTLTAFFAQLAQAAGHIAGGGLALAGSLTRFAIALASRLPYILFVYVPQLVGALASQVIAWTLEYVGQVENRLHTLANDVLSWAQGQVNALFGDLNDLRTWAMGQLADIINTLTWTWHLVATFLTDPNVLAQWLLGALFNVAKQWVEANSVALVRWGLSVAVSGTIRAAGLIEDIIVRIL